MLAEKIIDRGAVPQQTEYGGDAGGKFIDFAGKSKEKQKDPVPQRRLVVIIFPVQGGRDVVAGKLHLQGYQRADALVIDKGQLAQVDQQSRRQKGQYARVEPGPVC